MQKIDNKTDVLRKFLGTSKTLVFLYSYFKALFCNHPSISDGKWRFIKKKSFFAKIEGVLRFWGGLFSNSRRFFVVTLLLKFDNEKYFFIKNKGILGFLIVVFPNWRLFFVSTSFLGPEYVGWSGKKVDWRKIKVFWILSVLSLNSKSSFS